MDAEQIIELEFVEGSRFFRVPSEFWFNDSRTNFWYEYRDGCWELKRLNLGNNSSYWEVQEEELSFDEAKARYPDSFPMLTKQNARLQKKVLSDLKLQRELETDTQVFEDPEELPLGFTFVGPEDGKGGREYSRQPKEFGTPVGRVGFSAGRSFLGRVTEEKWYICVIDPTGEYDHQLTIWGPRFDDKNEAQKWVVQKLNELCR
jgi:hypothetical protein